MSTLLYQQSNLDICWDDQEGWLYADWKGYQAVEEVKVGCEQMLRLLKIKNAGSVLNDNTRVEGIWIGAADWVALDWFPRMQSAGLRSFAWVYSPARFSQVSTDAVLEKAASGITRSFHSQTEAANWLRSRRRPGQFPSRF